MSRARVLSCIQPTGDVHLGNYIGAIKNWVSIQDSYDCIYGIVDYHAITTSYSPRNLRRQSLDMAMDLLACGIDPEKTILFVQSHVPEHMELCWILNAVTAYGDLTRMTQFKTKASETDFVNAGLFNYPILQAADILIYKARWVPVGRDQAQHVELSREIARKFNGIYGETFVEPEVLLTRGASIRSLADPERKMSKSHGEKHYIGLMEDEASIEKKVRRAVTDTGDLADDLYMSPGVENLFTILGVTDPTAVVELESLYRGGSLMYSDLKREVLRAILTELAPIREKKKDFESSPGQVAAILRQGAEKARQIAKMTMAEVREKVGVGEPIL